MKKIDLYIIKKFFGTFFFSLALILMIVIVFDISEKIDDFLEHELKITTIIKEYYLNFIPYFGNLFSPLFIFISVIFFTSRMANNTEIIAILNSGMSFYRMLRPFLLSSLILAILSFIFGNFIIPSSNKERIEFENKYLRYKNKKNKKDIHIQIRKDQYIYMQSFNPKRNIGYKFTIEKFEKNKLTTKLKSEYIQYDSISNSWKANKYQIRKFEENGEIISNRTLLDTVINLHPKDFIQQTALVETMNFFELNKYIKQEKIKGSEQIINHQIEKYKRLSFPFSTIILTLIAVSISSNKVRGGIAFHLGLGMLIAFSYILFMQITTTFAINSSLSPLLAVWSPNIFFIFLSLILIRYTPK